MNSFCLLCSAIQILKYLGQILVSSLEHKIQPVFKADININGSTDQIRLHSWTCPAAAHSCYGNDAPLKTHHLEVRGSLWLRCIFGGGRGSHSAAWRRGWASACCCCLFRMMLMMSPSWSFMCSIRCSLLVDSKPQMQQQNRRTQYSMPAPGAGAWLRVEHCTDTLGSRGSVAPVRTLPGPSTDTPTDPTAASAEAFALSFGGWTTGGHSATTSMPADLCGALGGG